MCIDQILYPIKSLGPGNRVVIWTVGCHRRCPGCSNPELWNDENRSNVPVNDIVSVVTEICTQNSVDGITITGGEPFEQALDLLKLVNQLSFIIPDILIFSGYTYEEIVSSYEKKQVLKYISVLVDGQYEKSLNDCLPLRGSSNQRVLLFSDEFEQSYREYLDQSHSSIQNIHSKEGTISVGIHKDNFQKDIDTALRKKGIRRIEDGSNEMA